jgi:S-adenosylmethionine:tRNA ribosyltransferase-isomerase
MPLDTRHPSTYAGFDLPTERARNYLLPDRAQANLLVTSSTGQMQQARVADLANYVPPGTVLVLNESGTFFARLPGALMPDGSLGTIHFAQMYEDTALHWIVVVPPGLHPGDTIRLPGEASLQLMRPHLVRGQQPSWEEWGDLWLARFESDICFDHYHPQFCRPIQYPYDTMAWRPEDLQNCFSGRATSAMMNNGGRNLTPGVLESLLSRGIRVATLEMRTGVGVDHEGIPLPEYVSLSLTDAITINAAIAQGALVLPVGTGVIRALDWFYDRSAGRVRAGRGWCDNVITPESGTWLRAWVSGMHEPKSTHLAMGSAIMTEELMRAAMVQAYLWGFLFHENGDSHLHMPATALG